MLGLQNIVHPFRRAQITSFIADKASMEVSKQYAEYADVFSEEAVAKLLKHTRINDHYIDLEEGKQPPYGPIYSLRLVKLKMLKTYIENNLKNSFISHSSPLLRHLSYLSIKPMASYGYMWITEDSTIL